MISISVCMIVKNEENVLERCLTSLAPIADEIIIVDTGSVDKTKEIAYKFTDKVYDYIWMNDFSAARNYSFEKATMEYIYIADADEVLDEANLIKFQYLKECLLPEIDIVQMYYENQLQYNTTYNYDKEYRPKLVKRLRTFLWQDPIHESLVLEPCIFDSDISIVHLPEKSHAKRDFKIYEDLVTREKTLSEKLITMYAKELFIAGEDMDFQKASSYFEKLYAEEGCENISRICESVLAYYYQTIENLHMLMKIALHNIASKEPSSEVCFSLGEYYFRHKDYKEATIWYYNAAYEAECELNLHFGGDYPLLRLADCYKALGNVDQMKQYYFLAEQFSNEHFGKISVLE